MATATRGTRARASRGNTRSPKRGQRILFLGITGVDKIPALQRLAAAIEEQRGSPAHIVDFEREFLWPIAGLELDEGRRTFLDSDIREQWSRWEKAWGKCLKKIDSLPAGDPVLLAMHGCVLRKHYGARCALNPTLVGAEFQPDLVVTLIDDVYEMWWRTEGRADAVAATRSEKRSVLGRPTLEQLIVARRQEVMIGDLVANLSQPATKNLMLSVNHPTKTFTNCVLFPRQHRVVYLSFPISQPRRLEQAGDVSAKTAVSSFIAAAFKKQSESSRLVVECPLMIDELPLINMLTVAELAADEGRELAFDRRKRRWNLDDLCAPGTRLSQQSAPSAAFSAGQLLDAHGNIDTDVTFRDYRLVEQADILVVFNPILTPGRETVARSVRSEIDHAVAQHKHVFVFQDRTLDPKYNVWKNLGLPTPDEGGGQMDESPDRGLVTIVNSVEELLSCIK